MSLRWCSTTTLGFSFEDCFHDLLTTGENGGLWESVAEAHVRPWDSGRSAVRHAFREQGVTRVATAACCDLSSGGVRAGYDAVNSNGGLSLVLLVDCDMPVSTMARAAVTATEAVTCVLQDAGVRDTRGELCTGCARTHVAVVRNRGSDIRLRSAGKHNVLGQLIGESVYEAVLSSAQANGFASPRDPVGLLRSAGLSDADIAAASGLDGPEELETASSVLARDQRFFAIVSSVLFLRDEASWGLIPEDTVSEIARHIASTTGLDVSPGCDPLETALAMVAAAIRVAEVNRRCPDLGQQPSHPVYRDGSDLDVCSSEGGDSLMTKRPVYPFSAIVGQESMKEALLLNTINPLIGGVLIRGEKGTAKSTTVRALADLLPDRAVVAGCPCGCDWDRQDDLCPECAERLAEGRLERDVVPMRVVELPLSSTEDRVAGTIDIEYAISTGRKKFEPGVLAKANGNILYVDEVNLLDDHIVDLLLDAAAMGVNYIEREGISYSHPSRFILVGTMNPEEGDLRPQLLDRFGLVVDVEAERDEERRMEIIQRRMDFEKDPEGFCEDRAGEQQAIRDRISNARSLVGNIEPSAEVIRAAVRIPLHLDVDGHRADLTLIKAASAYAALCGRSNVTTRDVVHVSRLVMPHRMRRNPFQDSTLDTEELDAWLNSTFGTGRDRSSLFRQSSGTRGRRERLFAPWRPLICRLS